jgi:superfamily II DNA/RNA helicase
MRSLPEKHQTLLFSATMPVEIEALAKVSFSWLLIFSKSLFSPLSHVKIMWAGWYIMK